MKKIVKAFTALWLMCALLIASMPLGTVAQTETERIVAQIGSAYTKSLQLSGRTSFDGWCGAYVKYQLQALNVISSKDTDVAGNGNKIYGNVQTGTTTMGYQKNKYAGNNCLYDIISAYGGENVYNIIVSWTYQYGYSTSNPGAGHATLIHAIINNTVYFSESYNSTYAQEGAAQSCSVSTFYARYNRSYGDAIGAVHFTKSVPSSVEYTSISDGNYFIKHLSTGQYMDVDNLKDANNTNIKVYEFNGSTAQEYQIVTTPSPGGYKIRPHCSNTRVINNYGNTVASGNNVCLWDDTSDASQRWQFQAVSGGFVIRNVQNAGCVLDVSGTNVYMNTYSGAASQTWVVQNQITYDANGGSGAPAAQMKDYNTALTLSSTIPTRSGYTFLGWSTSSSATSAAYQAGGTYPASANSNTTLYAVWAVADTAPPVISDVKITDITPTGYTVVCTVSDNVGVARVSFPSWTTQNDQDDILWVNGALDGTTATFRMDIGNHNNEYGEYKTHIYAYDAEGNYGSYCDINILVEKVTVPKITASFNGHVYAVYDVNFSWTSANSHCEKMGGHLVTINSQEEQQFLEQLIGDRYYWIGASDAANEGVFQWVTGELFEYCNWAATQPDDYKSNQDYAYMNYKEGVWDDEANVINQKTGFIVEIEPLTPVKTIEYNGNRYEFYDNDLTWTEAKVYCENMGGHLVTITSSEEQNAIVSEMMSAEYYLIGASDQAEEGVWKWVTGETFDIDFWEVGQPDNTGSCEEWAGIWNTGEWNDFENYYAALEHGFICEIEAACYGDVNADGIVDMTDAFAVYTSASGGTVSDAVLAKADVNSDGVVDMSDAFEIYRLASGA